MTAPDPRIEAVDRVLRAYGLQGDVGKKMRQDILAAALTAVPEPETLGYAVAYPKADYWRVFAGYMGGLEPSAEEMKAEAVDAGDWNDSCRIVRVVAT